MSKEEKMPSSEQYKQYKEYRENFPQLHWRAWGSWFSWGSPVGLGLFFLAVAGSVWIITKAF